MNDGMLREEIATIMEELEELVNNHPIIEGLMFRAPSFCCEGEMMTYSMGFEDEDEDE